MRRRTLRRTHAMCWSFWGLIRAISPTVNVLPVRSVQQDRISSADIILPLTDNISWFQVPTVTTSKSVAVFRVGISVSVPWQ